MDVLMPRLIRPVPHPLGAYFRPNRADHRRLIDFVSAGTPTALQGIVFDPLLDALHNDLRDEVTERKIEAVFDPRAMELATPGGFSTALRKLPWAGDRPHVPEALSGENGKEVIEKIVQWCAPRSFTAILAPTHFLSEGENDPWLRIDRQLTCLLRERLDSAGLKDTPIYYPLAVRAQAFFDERHREQFRSALLNLPIDALWLRVHPFGSRSRGRSVRQCVRACAAFHSSGLPIVAERSGTIGLALLAFGAVGGIESGITLREHCDVNSLLSTRPKGKGFMQDARVYVPELLSFLDRKRARKFFDNRAARAYFGCKETNCCRDGADDMLAEPKPHFMRRRLGEIARLSEVPETLRASRYMEEFLRPATDKMIKAVKVEPALATSQERLASLRTTLGALLEEGMPATFSAVPDGRRIQIRRGA